MAIKLIQDQVWNNGIFSGIEESIFSHSLFNRLHNIIQNSCGYMVYPSNRTSRFSHSLGVMMLASRIFNYGLGNANRDVVKEYLENKKERIVDLVNSFMDEHAMVMDNMHIEYLQTVIGKSGGSVRGLLASDSFTDAMVDFLGPEYVSHTSVCIRTYTNDKGTFNAYLLLHQTLRIFALLHDIGHLPYSHLSEYAIIRLGSEIRESDELKENVKEDYVKILSVLQGKGDGEEKLESLLEHLGYGSEYVNKKIEIHEIIGRLLMLSLLEEVASIYKNDDVGKQDEEDCMRVIVLSIIKTMLSNVFRGEDGWLNSLYEIVSSGFDVDKVDYVCRDGYASGINPNFDTDRIIKLFCLEKRASANNGEKYDEKYDIFKFYPTLQVLNDVNELFNARFRIYKYVVGHHKVKRYDYMLQTIITALLRKYVFELSEREKAEIDEFDRHKVGYMIRAIMRAMTNYDDYIKNNANRRDLCYDYSLFTDSWLLTVLNAKMITLMKPGEETNQEKILRELLGEFFTASKRIRSLWKRDHEYMGFCKNVGKELKGHILESSKRYLNKNEKGNFVDDDENIRNDIYLFLRFRGHKGVVEKEDDLQYEDVLNKINDMGDVEIGKYIVLFLKDNHNSWYEDYNRQCYEKGHIVLISEIVLKTPSKDLEFVDIKNTDEKPLRYSEISKTPEYLEKVMENSAQYYVYAGIDGINEGGERAIICDIIKYIRFVFLTNNKGVDYVPTI